MKVFALSLMAVVLAGRLSAQPAFEFAFEPALAEEPLLSGEEVLLGAHGGTRSFLGVGVADIDADRAKALNLKLADVHGVEITKVEDGSPAAKAGLKKGDVILEYSGQRVEGTEQFVRMVRETPAGREVRLSISREGNQQTLTATIGSRKEKFFELAMPKDPGQWQHDLEELRELKMPDVPKPFMSWRTSMLGVEAESVDSQLAEFFGVKEGVLVRSVLKGTPAEKAGLKAGDVIVKVDDTKVASPRDVSHAIREARSKKTFPVTVVRNRKETIFTVTMNEGRPEKGSAHPVRMSGAPEEKF